MNKEKFLKQLDLNLKYLSKEKKTEYLTKYQDLDTSNLDPQIEASKIYEELNINYNIKFIDAMTSLVDKLKDKTTTLKTLLFFLYLLLVIIFIKIPFIYVRDLTLNLFNNLFTNNVIYTLWNISFELLYAGTTIIILIRLIKNKAIQIKYEEALWKRNVLY